MVSLFDHKVSELHQLLHKKEITVTDLVSESYKRIGEVEDKVQAFLTLDEERAREAAKKWMTKSERTKQKAFCSECRSELRITS